MVCTFAGAIELAFYLTSYLSLTSTLRNVFLEEKGQVVFRWTKLFLWENKYNVFDKNVFLENPEVSRRHSICFQLVPILIIAHLATGIRNISSRYLGFHSYHILATYMSRQILNLAQAEFCDITKTFYIASCPHNNYIRNFHSATH